MTRAALPWAFARLKALARRLLPPALVGVRVAGAPWLLVCGFPAWAAPVTQEVSFPSQDKGVMLVAYWSPPASGTAKAPAVVALHGCGGLSKDRSLLNYAQNRYIRMFHDAGLGVLFVDSLGPRGQTSLCEQKPAQRTLTEAHRRLDTLGALDWLATQADVDAGRLAVVGWSHGGQTVLATGNRTVDAVAQARVKPAALVAFYPGCTGLERQGAYAPVAPLLIMSGALDNWTPALPCQQFSARQNADKQPVRYVQYPDSYHAFDSANPVIERDNVGGTLSGKAMVGGNPAARTASAEELMRFLGAALGFVPDLSLLDESVHATPLPPASGYAALADVERLPHASDSGKTLYREWLQKPFPRAVALSDKGALARAYGRTAMAAALKNCAHFGSPCRLYAVDERVVWPVP